MPLHLFLIHFPVSLIVTAALLEVAGLAMTERSLRLWAGRLLIAGGLIGMLAFLTGEGARLAGQASNELDLPALEVHQQWGSVGAIALLLVAFLRAMWRSRLDGSFGWINAFLALAAVALVVAITLSGTLVRHGG